ncbi:MAG: UbiA prenyltransferase family protein [Desulfatibacillaceae bacterium]
MIKASPLQSIRAYARLFRADAAAICFFGTLSGAFLAGGPTRGDLAAAFCLTGFSMNFVYSFNSWADRTVDAENKPDRPLPAGRIAPDRALAYSVALFVLALAWPPVVAGTRTALVLFLILPVLGLLYSARPVRFKARPFAAQVVTAAGLTIPLAGGLAMHGRLWPAAGFVAGLFLYTSGMVMLKDVEDAPGDTANGLGNVYAILGRRIAPISLAGPAAGLTVVLLAGAPPLLAAWVSILCVGSAAVVLWHDRPGIGLSRAYTVVIRCVELWGGVLLAGLAMSGVAPYA